MKLYAEPKVVPISSKNLMALYGDRKLLPLDFYPMLLGNDPRFARLTQEKVKVTELNEEESDSDY